jgi:hypothetical protein
MNRFVRQSLVVGVLTGILVAANCSASTLPETPAGVSVSVDTNGVYEIRYAPTGWTFGGSVGSAIHNIKTSSGVDQLDKIGLFQEVSFGWGEGFTGSIRRYSVPSAVLFSVNMPAGVNATNVALPSFTTVPTNLHGFSYAEKNFAPPSFKLEQNGTPWLLFDDAMNTVVLSPAANFLIARMTGDGRTQITSGLNPEIGTLDKPLTHRTFIYFGPGIGETLMTWGIALTDYFGKNRPGNADDSTLKYFGYWTDNGADCYYNYDKELGYRGTLLKLADSYRHQNIKLGYLQLDSWWYQKSTRDPDGKPGKEKKVESLPAGRWNRYGGTMEYSADPDLFPQGLAAFQKELGLPLVVHGRWVDRESPYQKQFKFSGVAAIDPAYWNDRMSYLAKNGVVCYEQDWLDRIYFNSDLGRVVSAGDAFADGMAAACATNGLVMQYCMALPRHFLQGAKYSNLTTIRTSGDRFEPGKWRAFLYTSQLASALGIWPWCDVFKSGETGNMTLAVLSGGVVGTGDAMGKEAPENIRLAARADGVLVKPDRPLVPTDDTYLREARGVGGVLTAWTCTDHGDHRTLYAFAFVPKGTAQTASQTNTWEITPATFGIRSPSYVYDVTRRQGRALAAGETYRSDVTSGSYSFVVIAPVGPSGICFLGDKDKIASTGKQRIADIRESAEMLQVTVLTAPGEVVTLHGFADFAPACRIDNDKQLPVQYDTATKEFTVVIDTLPGGGQQVVTFRRSGSK